MFEVDQASTDVLYKGERLFSASFQCVKELIALMTIVEYHARKGLDAMYLVSDEVILRRYAEVRALEMKDEKTN